MKMKLFIFTGIIILFLITCIDIFDRDLDCEDHSECPNGKLCYITEDAGFFGPIKTECKAIESIDCKKHGDCFSCTNKDLDYHELKYTNWECIHGQCIDTETSTDYVDKDTIFCTELNSETE
jgi:hypothetical protein